MLSLMARRKALSGSDCSGEVGAAGHVSKCTNPGCWQTVCFLLLTSVDKLVQVAPLREQTTAWTEARMAGEQDGAQAG